MKVINTKFKGLKIISQKKNSDSRGNLREIYKKKIIKWDKLIFDYATTSKKNVLRGFHFQTKFEQAKYVNVLKGKIFDCVVDLENLLEHLEKALVLYYQIQIVCLYTFRKVLLMLIILIQILVSFIINYQITTNLNLKMVCCGMTSF